MILLVTQNTMLSKKNHKIILIKICLLIFKGFILPSVNYKIVLI